MQPFPCPSWRTTPTCSLAFIERALVRATWKCTELQIRNPKSKSRKLAEPTSFEHFLLRILNLFRISDFEFRIFSGAYSILLSALLATGCRGPVSQATVPAPLEIGAAEVDITPPIGFRMAGYFDE